MRTTSEYFYGNKVSNYGLENGYVDYRTLAKSFNAVLNNDIMNATAEIGFWECITPDAEGYETEDGDFVYHDVYQFYIVDDNGAEILREAGEIVYRNDELDLNVWGVTHYGTAWDYVLTNIKIEKE